MKVELERKISFDNWPPAVNKDSSSDLSSRHVAVWNPFETHFIANAPYRDADIGHRFRLRYRIQRNDLECSPNEVVYCNRGPGIRGGATADPCMPRIGRTQRAIWPVLVAFALHKSVRALAAWDAS